MKKINQIIHLLFLSIALFSSALLAQQAPPVTAQGVHLGTKNKYSIGTSDTPVLAPEYKDFLNDKSSSDRPWIESSYYDSSFMNASNNWSWQNNSKAAIYRTGTSGNYSYSVISGHENDIIDAVYSQRIQQEFNSWRDANAAAAELAKNPTLQELCDYINDKIAGKLDPSYLDKATEIQNRYPNAAGLTVGDINAHNSWHMPIFIIDTPSGTIETLWQQVNELVAHIYGYDSTDSIVHMHNGQMYTTTTHYAASDAECNNFVQRWGMVFSNENDTSLNFPAGMPKHVALLDETKKDDRESWAAEYPIGAASDSMMFTLSDTAVVTKIPCNPPAPDNGDTPAPEAQN
ncbi:MAG: hypothetical protein NT164_07380 [Verrucomicrobiae bacterium]|nr:hypothetical protein [Verrucomicrobiae bacterium]